MKRIIVSFLAFALLITMLAAVPTEAKKTDVLYNSVLKFTQIRGALGGADYEILMPDKWNGMEC